MPKSVTPFPVFFGFFFGGGCRKNSGCLRAGGGVQRKNEGNPRGVYKIHTWIITNSSGPPYVINTDWSLSKQNWFTLSFRLHMDLICRVDHEELQIL